VLARGPLELLLAQGFVSASPGIRNTLDGLPPLTREPALDQVTAAAAGLLDINLADVLAAGWQKHADLTAAARHSLATPGSTDVVDLASHRISSVQEPYVTILVDGHRVATVRFEVSLAFEISALVAEIQAGRLVALRSARCVVTGTLAIQGISVITRQAHIDLPGIISLRKGIRLLSVDDYPADLSSEPANGQIAASG